MLEPPAESVQPASDTMSYTTAKDLAALREFVRSCGVALGLSGSRRDLLALAVNELATNTLQYTDGGGTVRVWVDAGQVICDVLDTGPTRTFGAMPPPDSVRGRGLAIVERVVDEADIIASPEGTLVRIRMNL